MAAYVIAGNDVTNLQSMQQYVKAAAPTLAPFAGKLLVPTIEFLATGGAIVHLEGGFKPTRVVVIEFPNMERAQAWYDSDEYQAIINLRLEGSVGSVLIADGV
ncbi:MAG: DUF1330 domain-containing protein [Alphaproteobacteria bacterium]